LKSLFRQMLRHLAAGSLPCAAWRGQNPTGNRGESGAPTHFIPAFARFVAPWPLSSHGITSAGSW